MTIVVFPIKVEYQYMSIWNHSALLIFPLRTRNQSLAGIPRATGLRIRIAGRAREFWARILNLAYSCCYNEILLPVKLCLILLVSSRPT